MISDHGGFLRGFFHNSLGKKLANGGTPLHIGASLAVYLASEESNGITGKLISASWDPWSNFDQYKKKLSDTDIYTLRRITPEDRGEKW